MTMFTFKESRIISVIKHVLVLLFCLIMIFWGFQDFWKTTVGLAEENGENSNHLLTYVRDLKIEIDKMKTQISMVEQNNEFKDRNVLLLKKEVASFQKLQGKPVDKLSDNAEVIKSEEELKSYDPIQELGNRSSVIGSKLQEVWAGGSLYRKNSNKPEDKKIIQEVSALLSNDEKEELRKLCGRCIYSSIFREAATLNMDFMGFVTTGDIADMWTRDSAVEMGIYIPRMNKRPILRLMVEGAIRRQAFNILEDPWANAYYRKWRKASSMNKFERLIGRGGLVATRNFELDSGAYFMNQIHNYYYTPHLQSPESFIEQSLLYEAVSLMIDVWIIEQNHESQSPYRYSELPREGLGPKTGYTGLIWTGFRPSDDPVIYAYNIPGNMYAAGSIKRILEINKKIWKSESLRARATKLYEDILKGISTYGVIEVNGELVYAYEVNGLGEFVINMDDANVPSLLSIPLLGFDYDNVIYQNTRKRLLNKNTNLYYYSGSKLQGIGSPHTVYNTVWPMALAIQGLTSNDSVEKAKMLKLLLKCQCGNGMMHESVDANNLDKCTRTWFEWANVLLVTVVEDSLGLDCDAAGDEERLLKIKAREEKDKSSRPKNGGPDIPEYYELFAADIEIDQ